MASRIRNGVVAGTGILLLTAGALLPAVVASGAPRRGTAAGTSVDGVWRSDGYAQVFVVRGGSLRSYQTAGPGCLPGPSGRRVGGGNTFGLGDDRITFARDGTRATARIAGSPGIRRLRPVPALPSACTREAASGPVAVFDTFWRTFAENYPFFAAHGVDWRETYARYRPQVGARTTPARLFAVLSAMVRPLHDAHVYVAGATPAEFFAEARPGTLVPGPELDRRVLGWVTATDLGGKAPRELAGGRVQWARLPDGRMYLRISGFAGYTAGDGYAADAKALDTALDTVFTPANVARTRGLVVDLRVNGGGYDSLGLKVAERLAARPYIAYAKRARNAPGDPGAFTRPQPVTVRPYAGPRCTGPVAVLTSGSTVSAGETFTQALIGRPSPTVRVGTATQGVFSDVMDRALPNGWTFGLPNEEFRTAGRAYDVTGIPPRIPAPALPAAKPGDHDPAMTAARSWLARHGG